MQKAVNPSDSARSGILTGRAPPTFAVHGLDHALDAAAAAAASGVAVRILSGPGAAAYAGVAWFAAIEDRVRAAYPLARIDFTLDCDDAPGHALAALRQGARLVRLCGDRRAVAAVAAIAAGQGAAIDRRRGPVLDISAAADPAASARDFLSPPPHGARPAGAYIEK